MKNNIPELPLTYTSMGAINRCIEIVQELLVVTNSICKPRPLGGIINADPMVNEVGSEAIIPIKLSSLVSESVSRAIVVDDICRDLGIVDGLPSNNVSINIPDMRFVNEMVCRGINI